MTCSRANFRAAGWKAHSKLGVDSSNSQRVRAGLLTQTKHGPAMYGFFQHAAMLSVHCGMCVDCSLQLIEGRRLQEASHHHRRPVQCSEGSGACTKLEPVGAPWNGSQSRQMFKRGQIMCWAGCCSFTMQSKEVTPSRYSNSMPCNNQAIDVDASPNQRPPQMVGFLLRFSLKQTNQKGGIQFEDSSLHQIHPQFRDLADILAEEVRTPCSACLLHAGPPQDPKLGSQKRC